MKHWGNKRTYCICNNQHSWLKAKNDKLIFYLCKKCNTFHIVTIKEKKT